MAKNLLGTHIKKVRRLSLISQSELCERLAKRGLAIDRSALSRIENGSRAIADYELFFICAELGIKLDVLFKESDLKFPNAMM
jgi:transcriptional regulator with XRE-family HTH domain